MAERFERADRKGATLIKSSHSEDTSMGSFVDEMFFRQVAEKGVSERK